MSCNHGEKIRVQIFGQSHAERLGVVIDGLPAGLTLDMEHIQMFLERRRGGKGAYVTARTESDIPDIVSGLYEGKTCGAPLCAVFQNTDVKSDDYDQFRDIPRPGHADYPARIKYHGANDIRGGGHFSGRLTLPLCFAGAVCNQLLEQKGIYIGAHIASIANVHDEPYDPVNVSVVDFDYPTLPVNDPLMGEQMYKIMTAAAKEGDSLGGIIECAVLGLPVGLGNPMFDGIENRIASAMFAVPAVKGIEFGAGFAAADMKGSEHNDEYTLQEGGITVKTNHAGGILGGLATGAPVMFRVVIKPTPSIAKEQNTVNLETHEHTTLLIEGRHDACIVPRAVPCIQAATAIAIINLMEDLS